MKFLWLIGIVLSIATPAAAQQYVYAARTAAPVARQGAVTAGNLTWQCQGSECRITGPWAAPAAQACAALAQQVGRIVSYGRQGRMLDAAGLATCNAALPAAAIAPPVQVQPNVRVPPNVILRAPPSTAPAAPPEINSSELSFVGGDPIGARATASVEINSPELTFIGGAPVAGSAATSTHIDVPELSFIGR